MKNFAYIYFEQSCLNLFLRNALLFNKNIKIKSGQKKEAEGCLIPVGLTAKEKENKALIIEKIISAALLAKKSGAGIIGLGGPPLGLSGNDELILAKTLKIPLTTGASLTAWSLIEAAYCQSQLKKRDFRKLKIAVIPADWAIASLCAIKCAKYAAEVIMATEEEEKLKDLKEKIVNRILLSEKNITRAVEDADIVINTGIFNQVDFIAGLKPGAIACNIYNPALTEKIVPPQRITMVTAGLIKLPHSLRNSLIKGLPKNIIPSALAEVMLLALEGKLTNYSLGDNINPDNLEEIADLAVQHGFEVWVKEEKT